MTIISNLCVGQTTRDKICGKKWYPNKYKEANGKVYLLDKETKLLYTKFNCDGTFESWEDKEILVKGTWTFEEKKQTISVKSKNKRIPTEDNIPIISCDGKNIAFVKIDGGGEKITIYSIAK